MRSTTLVMTCGAGARSIWHQDAAHRAAAACGGPAWPSAARRRPIVVNAGASAAAARRSATPADHPLDQIAARQRAVAGKGDASTRLHGF